MSACDLLKMSALESKVMQIERENTILKQKLSECLVMIDEMVADTESATWKEKAEELLEREMPI